MDEITILLRLLIATGLGVIVGYERERSHKIAGLRTHSLVALGSALFAIVSISAFQEFLGVTTYDPSRVVAGIVVGIGFIGAGSIMRSGKRVTGTTTAAGLWATAAIGTAVGLGLIFPAIFATAIVYTILAILSVAVRKIHEDEEHHIPTHGDYIEEEDDDVMGNDE